MMVISELCSDSVLVEGIKTCCHTLVQQKANATYQSASIQNEQILIAGNLVRDKVLNQIAKAKCWTILANDIMDRHKREQCAICIRYLCPNKNGNLVIKEDP